MPDFIRTFIAIELDPSVRESLLLIQRNILKAMRERLPDTGNPPQQLSPKTHKALLDVGGIKWVAPDNLHLTLKFLGNLTAEQLIPVQAALKETAHCFEPFHMLINGLGAFPNSRTPRVVWIGVMTEKGLLERIAQTLEANLADYSGENITEPKEFQAHITLGRLRNSPNKNLTTALENISMTDNITQHVTRLTLFKSQLNSEGPVYSALATYPLHIIHKDSQ